MKCVNKGNVATLMTDEGGEKEDEKQGLDLVGKDMRRLMAYQQ